jgi:hypothetical protein
MSIKRTKYRVDCNSCTEVREFHIEKNRSDWVHGHTVLHGHYDVKLSEVEADLSREEYEKLMQP